MYPNAPTKEYDLSYMFYCFYTFDRVWLDQCYYIDNNCTSYFLYDTDSSNYRQIDEAYALLHILFFMYKLQSGSFH